MHSMDADTAENTFREFCSTFVNTDDDVRLLVMYRDAHRSLIRMCDNLKMRRRHPPPGRPQANAVVERKIGLALSGIRAYLSTGCLPFCF